MWCPVSRLLANENQEPRTCPPNPAVRPNDLTAIVPKINRNFLLKNERSLNKTRPPDQVWQFALHDLMLAVSGQP